MSDKEMVLERVRQLPENVPLEQTIEEVEIFASIQRGIKAADLGKTKPHDKIKWIQWLSKRLHSMAIRSYVAIAHE